MPIPIIAAAGAFLRNAAKNAIVNKAKQKLGEKLGAEIQPHETTWRAAALLARWGTPALAIATVFIFAVGAGEAGQRLGVNNPREPNSGADEFPREGPDEPPPIAGDCTPLANEPRLSSWHANDRVGIPRGQIERVIGFPPDDPVGELVQVHGGICNTLIGMVNSNIPVLITAALDTHTRFVSGTNRISRHWVGAAIDVDSSEAIARYAFDHRTELGIDQIITGRWPQYNVNNGQPFDGYSQALLNQHMGHTHIGW